MVMLINPFILITTHNQSSSSIQVHSFCCFKINIVIADTDVSREGKILMQWMVQRFFFEINEQQQADIPCSIVATIKLNWTKNQWSYPMFLFLKYIIKI